MANWQASLLMQTLSTGSVLVLQRDKTDAGDVPTLHGGDTFYGSLPDGDPFRGTVMERQRGQGGMINGRVRGRWGGVGQGRDGAAAIPFPTSPSRSPRGPLPLPPLRG